MYRLKWCILLVIFCLPVLAIGQSTNDYWSRIEYKNRSNLTTETLRSMGATHVVGHFGSQVLVKQTGKKSPVPKPLRLPLELGPPIPNPWSGGKAVSSPRVHGKNVVRVEQVGASRIIENQEGVPYEHANWRHYLAGGGFVVVDVQRERRN